MKYPKKVMTIRELTRTDDKENPENNIGFSKEWLLEIYRSRSINRQFRIAWKQNENKPNSTIYFDTEALEKYRKSKCTGV